MIYPIDGTCSVTPVEEIFFCLMILSIYLLPIGLCVMLRNLKLGYNIVRIGWASTIIFIILELIFLAIK